MSKKSRMVKLCFQQEVYVITLSAGASPFEELVEATVVHGGGMSREKQKTMAGCHSTSAVPNALQAAIAKSLPHSVAFAIANGQGWVTNEQELLAAFANAQANRQVLTLDVMLDLLSPYAVVPPKQIPKNTSLSSSHNPTPLPLSNNNNINSNSQFHNMSSQPVSHYAHLSSTTQPMSSQLHSASSLSSAAFQPLASSSHAPATFSQPLPSHAQPRSSPSSPLHTHPLHSSAHPSVPFQNSPSASEQSLQHQQYPAPSNPLHAPSSHSQVTGERERRGPSSYPHNDVSFAQPQQIQQQQQQQRCRVCQEPSNSSDNLCDYHRALHGSSPARPTSLQSARSPADMHQLSQREKFLNKQLELDRAELRLLQVSRELGVPHIPSPLSSSFRTTHINNIDEIQNMKEPGAGKIFDANVLLQSCFVRTYLCSP